MTLARAVRLDQESGSVPLMFELSTLTFCKNCSLDQELGRVPVITEPLRSIVCSSSRPDHESSSFKGPDIFLLHATGRQTLMIRGATTRALQQLTRDPQDQYGYLNADNLLMALWSALQVTPAHSQTAKLLFGMMLPFRACGHLPTCSKACCWCMSAHTSCTAASQNVKTC